MSMLMLSYPLIFAARVGDVTLSTIRILLLMRGKALLASVIGFFEVTIFILALNQVVGNLDDPFRRQRKNMLLDSQIKNALN